LKCVKIEQFKFAHCRFKVSAHRLAVEVGRWHTPTKIPYNWKKMSIMQYFRRWVQFFTWMSVI